MNKTSVSLVLIVRDEEAYLERCVKSFGDIYDEFIVVDTGSVDKTVEIAKKLGARVEHFEWIQDFSAARNYACSLATKDWILMPDGDEYLGDGIDPRTIITVLEKASDNLDNLLIEDRTLLHGKVIMRHFVNRLFRNKKEVRWQNRVHETLNVPFNRLAKIPDIFFIHENSQKREPGMRLSTQRNDEYISILKKDLEENPNNARALFYLANTYNERQAYEDALKSYDQYFKIAVWDEETAQAYYNASFAAKKLEDFDLQRELLFKAMEKDHRRAEVYIQLGDLAQSKGKTNEAIHWYKTACRCEKPDPTLFLSESAYSDEPWWKLAQIYLGLKKAEEACYCAEEAAKINPEHEEFYKQIQTMKAGLFEVTIIIPTKNSHLTRKCLKSIYNHKSQTEFGVIVVVDGELTDFKDLAKEYPKVLFSQGVKPFIFARAMNQGITQSSNDVILMNDDIEVETDNWIDHLKQIAHYAPDHGLISPLISNVGNPRQSWENQQNVDAEIEHSNLMFPCVYIKREVFKKIGTLDEAFIWYGFEDNDFCLRAKMCGFKMLVSHKVRVRHEAHSSFRSDGNLQKMQDRAQKYFITKWRPKVTPTKTIIYFTWNRLDYTKRTLPRLIESTGADTRIIVFDNSSDADTVDFLRSLDEERIQIFLNHVNAGLSQPTNWLYNMIKTEFVGKVDNDTLVPDGWVDKFAEAHEKWGEELGLISGFHFMDEDWSSACEINIVEKNGSKIVKQPYVGGCCYLMRRQTFIDLGEIPTQSGKIGGWTEYQQVNLNLAKKLIGYAYPLVKVSHLDDPRHPETGIDEDYLWSTRRITKEQCAEWYRRDAKHLLTTEWK